MFDEIVREVAAAAWIARFEAVIIRRVAAVLLALSLAHLNVVRADAACGSHDASGPSAETVPSDSDHHAHHGVSEPEPAQDDGECNAPPGRDCCGSVASCGIALDFSARQVAEVPWLSVAVAAPNLILPPSIDTAPEPPPPRA